LTIREEAGSVIVCLDDGQVLEIAPASMPDGLPAVGELVPAPIHLVLVLAAERKQVARKLFAMLDRRLQPMARLRRKLVDQGYSEQAVDEVLERISAEGIHSDRRYAEAFCRDCLLNRAVGRRYLVDKLREKQVPGGLAAEVAAEILDEETERELAFRAAKGRWKRQRDPQDRRSLAKVVRFLQSRGFSAGLANQASRAEQPASEEPDY
jgi:SOS response regulatory protein OraA/RecX